MGPRHLSPRHSPYTKLLPCVDLWLRPSASAVVWEDIQRRIYAVIAKVFRAAAIAHPEIQSSQCRAIYGVDVMLDDQMRPKLLEVGGSVLLPWESHWNPHF